MRYLITLLCFGLPVLAQAEPTPPPTEELAHLLRGLLLNQLPAPVIEKSFGWGKTSNRANGVKWHKEGLLLKPEVMYKRVNDGAWRKIRVDADNPKQQLLLSVTDVTVSEPGKMNFVINVLCPMHVHFEQQIWESGVRLYSGSTRARCRVGLRLVCESSSRLETKQGSFLPDAVFRVRILEARMGYDQLKVEHTMGVGGDAAEILGNAFVDCIKQWKPSLESDLLEKGNKAILKAGDTKEIHVSLSKLLQLQKPITKKK